MTTTETATSRTHLMSLFARRATAGDVDGLMSLFARRAAAGDVDGLIALYEPDAVFEPQLGADE